MEFVDTSVLLWLLLTFNRVLLHSWCDGVLVRLMLILYNIPHFYSSCQAVNVSARHRNNPFSTTLALYPNFLTCPYSTTRTPVAPGCLVLPLHYLNREAWKMGCVGFIHQSQECCPLLLSTSLTSYIPGSLAPGIALYLFSRVMSLYSWKLCR